MKTLFVVRSLGLASLLFSTLPGRALDFTPQETWRPLEGVRIPVLMFSDTIGKIRYQPPGNWNFSGGGPTFTLYPPDFNGAVMKLLVLAHAPGIPEITSYPSEDLAKWCQRQLASDAQEVKLLQENPSPFMLTGKPCREFVFEYLSGGRRFQTSVAVLDWNEKEHLAVVITALNQDFKAVHDTGNSSLFSWSVRKADQPKAAPAPDATAASPTAPSAPGPTPIKASNR
ncbi:MAG TPA: hypothetical protein VK961_12200 [Chthoniobacter sp.]|nr:hypothetical protein [Chthoniobacter sp.]